MKWSIFSILALTLIMLLVCCASCGTNTSEDVSEGAQAQPTPGPAEPDPGPNKIFIHFNTSTHEIEKVIATGPDPQKKCTQDPPPANLEAAQQAAKKCFENEYPDSTETEPVLKIDTFKVNPTWCVIYDARGNKFFVPCGD